MWIHYLKTAWRSLRRNKSFSIINIFGLAVGMASALLIVLWLQNMLSMDAFHKNKKQLYIMANRDVYSGQLWTWTTTPKILGPTLMQEFPEVEAMTRTTDCSFLLSYGEKKLSTTGYFADSAFLSMFSFPLVKGNITDALNSASKIVITQKFATALFGNEDALGKSIKIDTVNYATVSGVLKDLPSNTKMKFDYLLSWDYAKKVHQYDEYWGNNSVQNFVLLRPNTNLTAFNNKIQNITIDHSNEETNKVFAFPVSKHYLYNRSVNGQFVTGRIVLVRMFAIIAVLILLIACINFMNLSTARSEKRAKEVGVRKVAGAHRSSLVFQFLFESVFIAVLAFLVAIGIVLISLPFFNRLVNMQLQLSFANPFNWFFALAFVLFTGMVAGSYPAFYLSSFNPVKVLKGTFRKVQSKVNLRSVLVVIQFTFAIVLIISTIIVTKQIRYTENRDNGYDGGNLVYSFLSGDIEKNYLLIKNELLQSGAVTSVTKTMSPITQQWSDGWGLSWPGSTKEDDKTDFGRFSADADFVKTMGAKLSSGRDIDVYNYSTDSFAVLLNETAAKTMRLKSPIGSKIIEDTAYHVVGVVKDFIIGDVSAKVEPIIIYGPNKWFNTLHYRLNSAKPTKEDLSIIKRIFKKYNPDYPFEYTFASDSYAQKFKETQRIGQLSTLFAVLTIFISCLGLLGLVTFMAEARTKEIGVRKVLGASISTIVQLLTKEFLILVIISFVIAAPIAWYAMHRWLSDFDYRVSIVWWWFALAGITAIIIAFGTISYQAIKAARANPVKSLKTE